jgi:hypothetical protein
MHQKLIPGHMTAIVRAVGISTYTTSMCMYIMSVLGIFTKKSTLLTMTDIVHMDLHTQEAVFFSEPQYMNRVFPWLFQ